MGRPQCSVAFETFTMGSSDGKAVVAGCRWVPEGVRPRAVVQVVHGMMEHCRRYDGFARHMARQGVAVCSIDHRGHGLSAVSCDDLGHVPCAEGADALLEDMRLLHDETRARMLRLGEPDVPYLVLGHSMGSFLARCYAARHGGDLAGLVLRGTGCVARPLSLTGRALARAIARTKGERHRSGLLHAMTVGSYAKAPADARTPFDWLSTDRAIVDAYVSDARCGQPFSAAAYAMLFTAIERAERRDTYGSTPQGLPVLLIAGGADPVGQNGAGVRRVARAYRKAGVRSVECRIYDGMRHEILDGEGCGVVRADLDAWIAKTALGERRSAATSGGSEGGRS